MSTPVRFKCKCGVMLSSSAYGKTVRCTQCQTILRVPTPKSQTSVQQPANVQQPAKAQQPAPTRQPTPVQRPATNPQPQLNPSTQFPGLHPTANRGPVKSKSNKPSNLGTWIGIASFALILVLGGVGATIAILMVNGQNGDDKKEVGGELASNSSTNGAPNIDSSSGGNPNSFPSGPSSSSNGSAGSSLRNPPPANSTNTSSPSGGTTAGGTPAGNSTSSGQTKIDFKNASLFKYNIKLKMGFQTINVIDEFNHEGRTWRGVVRIDRTAPHLTIEVKKYTDYQITYQRQANYTKRQMEEIYDDLKFSPYKEITVNGLPFQRVEWTGINKQHKVKFRGVLCSSILNNELVVIGYMHGDKYFEKDERYFKEFLNSYRVR